MESCDGFLKQSGKLFQTLSPDTEKESEQNPLQSRKGLMT